MERKLVFIGDIHGSFNRLTKRMRRVGAFGIDFVQVGDFGLGFHSFEKDRAAMQHLNDFLERRNCTISAFRGNHDDPELFEVDLFELPAVKIIPDNSIIELCGGK